MIWKILLQYEYILQTLFIDENSEIDHHSHFLEDSQSFGNAVFIYQDAQNK